MTPEEEKRFEIMLSLRLTREEHLRLEALLLERLKQHKSEHRSGRPATARKFESR